MATNQYGQYYYDPAQDQGANPNDPFLSPLAPSPGIPYLNSTDPRKVSQNQRALVQQRGDQLQEQNQILSDQAGGQFNNYLNFLNPIEQQLASGNGGYSQAELNKIQTSEGDQQKNFLTPQEQSGITGDTSQYGKYFNPEGMNSDLADQQSTQSGAVQTLQGGLDSAIDPNALTQSGDYRSRTQSQLGSNQTQASNVLGALGNNVRGALSDTRSGVSGAQGNESSRVRGAIDPEALSQSAKAADLEVMTPEQEAQMVTGAGISAGVRNQAAVGDLERSALAAGSSPQGVAAYRARMNLQSGAQAADAMTQARIAAQQTRAQEALLSEQQRLGGQQYLTGTQVGAEENLGGQDVASQLQQGQMASSAEQSMGKEALDSQNTLGAQALAQQNAEEANRQAAQQYLTGAKLQAATTGGEAQIQNAQLGTQQGQQQRQFNATTGTNIATTQEQAAAQRAAQLAQNRQNTQIGNEGQSSSQATTAGNARLGQQNTGLGLQSGNATQASQNQQAALQRQQQGYATQTAGTNQAANIGLAASQTPSTLDKVVGGIAGGISAVTSIPGVKDGGLFSSPTLAIVGEEGPEKVVSMDGYRSRLQAMQKETMRRKMPNYGEVA